MRRVWTVAAALAAWMLGAQAQAAEVSVAVAANFAAPLKRIAAAFEQHSGHRVLSAVGSTGSLYAQVVHGAPFQVFLSADQKTIVRLEAEGHLAPGTRHTYATGRLALWSAQPRMVDSQGEVLRGTRIQRLAIANPKLAPYGAAALETLDHLGLRAHWQPRIVQGENIAQVQQFIASGNAPLGFVALSQVMLEGRLTGGSVWVVPSSLHTPLKQDAALLKRGVDSAAARAFMDFLRSEPARAIIRAHGYED